MHRKKIKEECTHLYSIGVFGLHMEGEHNLDSRGLHYATNISNTTLNVSS